MIVKNAKVESSAGKQLALAMNFEPDGLYLYGGSSSGQEHFYAAINEAPFDALGYEPRPSMFEALPRLGDGAEVALVDVEPGESYVDPESGEVVDADEP